jgi:hypothetical protein
MLIHVDIATMTRGLLVRREALDLALYTFKFAPDVDLDRGVMPPPAGESSSILYLRKDDLKDQLHQPLHKTLPLDTPARCRTGAGQRRAVERSTG